MPKIAFDQSVLADSAGIHFPGTVELIENPAWLKNYAMACDAQPTLITNANGGIPALLTTFIDPKVIDVLVAPMNAAKIIGESKKGTWVDDVAMFPMIENTGVTSSYGDYSSNGSAGANSQFPQRQSYHYQVITQWGERELERAALAKLDWVSRQNIASVLVLNKFQNMTYFFGVAGLQNYGLLNDPALSTPITPITKGAGGVTWAVATAYEIYQDLLNMFSQLQTQANGLLTMDDKMTLALSPTMAVNLNKVSTYNVAVRTTLKENFPNMRIETAPEYSTQSGQLAQLIIDSYEGQDTAQACFTEKMRAHPIITAESSWKQKKTQGTWGSIIYRPAFISQMLGM